MVNSIISFTIEPEIANIIGNEALEKRMTVSHYVRTLIWELYKDKINNQEKHK